MAKMIRTTKKLSILLVLMMMSSKGSDLKTKYIKPSIVLSSI